MKDHFDENYDQHYLGQESPELVQSIFWLVVMYERNYGLTLGSPFLKP